MAFLHGVETIQIETGIRTINQVRTGVIGLVGIAPIGTPNTLEVVTNARDAVTKFGSQLPGFTIPQALNQIFAQGAGSVMVVNVFDPATMTAEEAAEALTIANGKATLDYAPIGAITLENAGQTETYVAGTDYSVDAYGVITVLDFGSIAEGASLLATYDRLDATQVAAADIIGEVAAQVYSGFQMFLIAQSTFGFTPKILISPTYCELPAVATEMITKAEFLRGVALIDAPSFASSSDTVSDVIAERGVTGTYAGFQSASKSAMLLYPYLKRYDFATDSTVLTPPSPYFAGIISASDNERGFWFSPSNRQIQGIVGVELNLTAAINDENSEVNLLNAAGITTVFQAFGTGIRTWGNRSAAYPSVTTPDNFIAVERVKNVLNESVELSMLQFIDLPISSALIDSIRESVNAYIRSLIQRGGLIDGVCLYNEDDNPPAQVANGQLVFQINFIPPSPAERITFNSFLDITLLQALTAA